MAHHFFMYSRYRPEGFAGEILMDVTYAGWTGVDLFFVLSGFLITGILLETKSRTGYFTVFYARRTLRIFPLYYAFLFAWFVILPLVAWPGPGFRSLSAEQGWYWTYMANVKIGREGWPELYDLGHFWSLAVEEQFYLFWPLVVMLLSRRRFTLVCAGIVAGAPILRLVLFETDLRLAAYVLTPARIDSLAIGALLSLAIRSARVWRFAARAARPVFAGSLLVLVVLAYREGGKLQPGAMATVTAGFTIIAIASAALIAIVLSSPEGSVIGRILGSRSMRMLGRYSYCLYVVHNPVALMLERRGFTIDVIPELFGSKLPATFVFATVAFGGSLAISVLSWHLFESRVLALKKHTRYGPFDTEVAVARKGKGKADL